MDQDVDMSTVTRELRLLPEGQEALARCSDTSILVMSVLRLPACLRPNQYLNVGLP
jgi:hypothetical protein